LAEIVADQPPDETAAVLTGVVVLESQLGW